MARKEATPAPAPARGGRKAAGGSGTAASTASKS